MSLLGRKPPRIGRAQRTLRDDRFFVIATEDTHAPKQYFENLAFPRVRVMILPTEDGRSSPGGVLERLRQAFDSAKERGEVQPGDEFWLVLDTDHWVCGNHLRGLSEALGAARREGFCFALSNPCFELWLLLHHEDVPPGTTFSNCEAVAERLRTKLRGYNKTNVQPADFPLGTFDQAIARARNLEATPDSPEGHWPQTNGTRVYLLLESILRRRPAA